jgi:hypothetical protein
MTVTEYRDRFLQLARYAPAEVANDGDKQERFREGLDDHLEYTLMNYRFDNFNQLVDAALNTERKRREIEDKKRKMAPAASGSNTRPRYQYPQPQQQHQRQVQQYQQRQQQYPPRPQQQQVGQGQRLPTPPHALLHRLHQLRGKGAYSSCRAAGSSTPTGVLSLRRAGALHQRLSSEGAVWTAGTPNSAQGSLSGQGEPRDGRVSGRGSQHGY